MRTPAALLALIPAAVLAQAPAPPASTPQDKIDAIFARYNRTGSPGCTVAASRADKTILHSAYGMADLEHSLALRPESVLEAGSVSKQFTAAALLLLAQQGKFSLDEPVNKYIPELPDSARTVTIRQLIHHTSGLRDWGSVAAIGGWPRTTRAYTHAHVLDIVSKQRALNYAPGEAYSYTNTGYNLAAILVTRVSGKPFAQFTREALFEPLGMRSTEWRDDFRKIVPGRAIAYSPTGSSYRMDMPFEYVHGNGGLLTTVGDLLRWNRNFDNPTVGGREFVEAQHRTGKLNNGREISYAAGLQVHQWRGIREVSHSGATAGYRAWLGRFPAHNLSIAVLCNLASANPTALGHQVAEVYLADALPARASEVSANVDAATLGKLAGLYRSAQDRDVVRIELENGQLRFDGRAPLRAISASSFAFGEEGKVNFELDASGSPRRASLNDPNGVTWFDRVEKVSPSASELQAYAANYESPEAEVTFKAVLEGDTLVLRRRPDDVIRLTPAYRDGFLSPLGSVVFLRDARGNVTEMSIGQGRVWDLRLKKIN